MIFCPDFEEAARKMLALDEDERQFAYDDKTSKRVTSLPTGGNLTIGIGRNLFAKGLRPDEIALCFRNDLLEALDAARRIFPNLEHYETNRILGIVNLIFNMGEGDDNSGFREFKETIVAIRTENWERAGERLRGTLWYRQVKERGPRVVALIAENRNEYER